MATTSEGDRTEGELGGAGGARDHEGDERDLAASRRDAIGDVRDLAGAARDVEGDARDATGHQRDLAADERDRAAEVRERLALGSIAPADRPGAEAHAASDRSHAARDRAAGAQDRSTSELHRHTSLADREAGEMERAGSERDRLDGSVDRAAAADERAFAARDPLTGAHSRAAGLHELTREMERARRSAQPLTLFYVDVDGLKAINDAHGHAAGDDALVAVVGAIRGAMRSYDLIVRMGGDEFVCALGGVDEAEAPARVAIATSALAAGAGLPSATFGIAEMVAEDSVASLIARADADLYDRRRRERGAHGRR